MRGWAETRRLKMDNPHLGQRNFHPRTRYRHPKIIEAFGSDAPHSKYVLLHSYASPESPSDLPPVLLVPGANKDANFFLDPDEDGRGRSLPEALRQAGRRVYALTFAHSQDDNWWCCTAINRVIRELTEEYPDERFDILGHSKGGFSVRLAVTDWRPDPACPEYLGHRIRRVLLMGAPTGGLDYFFRYPALNPLLCGPSENPGLNWPTTWTHIKENGRWREVRDVDYLSDFFPGQRQMLARWDEQYPLPGTHPQERVTYYGGESELCRSDGLPAVLERSGSLVEELTARPPLVQVALLAGASPTLPGISNDTSGPGDGIICIKSALTCPGQSRVVFMKTLKVHHKALAAEPEAQQAIVDALSAVGNLSLAERAQALEAGLQAGREEIERLQNRSR